MNIEVNYMAVLAAAVASMALGFVWYSALFGKPWMKLMGMTSESMKDAQKTMGKLYSISFLITLVSAYVLFHVMTMSMNFFHYTSLTTGLTSGFWMWLGFIMPVQVTGVLFGGKGVSASQWQLLSINTGYQLASLLVMGAVIGWMM